MIPHVVVEDGDIVVLFQPAGTVCKRRGGRRGGPRGRCLVEWDGTHSDVVFAGPPQVKVYEPGTAHLVHRSWDAQRAAFVGWYLNLESEWIRTPLGFDSWDQILDVEVADDLSWWRWKDEDELEWYVSEGRLSRDEAQGIHANGERVVERLEARSWPFDADWMQWRPDDDWPVPVIPDGWDAV